MKTWIYLTKESDQGKSLESILRDSGFSKKDISRQKFLPEGIMVDGKKCRVTAILKENQRIELHFKEEKADYGEFKEERKLPVIVYEDVDLLILNKPSGLSSHPGRGHYSDNLGIQAVSYCRKKGEEIRIRPVGRLDKDTSGLMVYAKSRIGAARLAGQRETGMLQKTYIVLVHGIMEQPEGMVNVPLLPVSDEKNRMQAVIEKDKEKGLSAVTHYRTIKVFQKKKFSLLECRLDTGRTHQIRVHMAFLNHPVVGDTFYGRKDGVKRLCLHGERIRLYQPFTGEKLEVQGGFFPGQEFPVDIDMTDKREGKN